MKRLYLKFSLWAFLVIIFLQMNGSRACLEKERIGLLEFKAFMKSNCEVDDNLDSWVEDGTSDCCDWERVTCSSISRRVVDLSLYWVAKHSSLGITCSLNLSMFYPFEELLSLDFSNNWFNGWIDKAGSERAALRLKKLQILDLSDNSFNNSILSFVGILQEIMK
uniref:Leucine-rich repeat-containing N-terminal plant-type domain-containing protein n=1 Tax=Manihot esculenta TaxID=3983 RepID=A0A199UAK4_MANES